MRIKLSFQIKLFLCLVAFSCVLLALIGAYAYYQLDAQLHRDLGARAQVQAREIALIPSLAAAVEKNDAGQIAALMKKIRASSDASYIVIGDNQARHLYHSEYDVRLGSPMVGGDNKEVLEGKSIISIRKGGIGVSLRSKAPIMDEHNQVIGIVSVGYLKSHIDNLNARTLTQIVGSIILLLAALFIFSWLLSKNLKRQMFWLEPKEIALLVRQQKALLEAIYEGVIAVDPQLRIITINHAARELLDLRQPANALMGREIGEVIQAQPDFFGAAQLGQDTHDEVCRFNHVRVIASRVRIMQEEELQGWVISFRDKNDINTLSSQLSQVKRYADNLRIMRHEQLNWTATLAGLLHMQRYDEAIRYVEAQSEGAQEILDFISQRFSSAALCGLLLGKYSSAKEKGVELRFDPACQLRQIPAALNETELMSIVGNLLDNAVEATLRCPAPHRAVELYISDGSNELVIEVADHGTGIAEEIRDTLFEQGMTTKDDKNDHGIGLHLVASHVAQAHGSIEVSDNEPHGAIFSLFIPKTL
ncbi:Sensor histidine kinase CitA [Serratia entomophila]|jgi:two-component system cit operon sensor histidine kinase CitA|uniref:ATP-binding protein n=1 Tax=Serratia entomophila TaxID=42906 RepID=UPI001F3A937F|nr:sensor histidine kinase [Serratia entomophila]UIW17444.1 sensor histidine kinase [Serratia entomophila]CAI0997728.1 Sensor histidine kinase CitA [Serratia entomophila]CAI1096357.1 Sensor histidine kinase CitA [Serratia entomophila]CAI1153398.1 Sensor histidine kinase CitA [Serratia entomophila]CAI1160201.1 Sensor histidine kinase CitA [Serratia entomophila]